MLSEDIVWRPINGQTYAISYCSRHALAPEMYDLVAYVATHVCQHPDEPTGCHFCAARAIVRKATDPTP